MPDMINNFNSDNKGFLYKVKADELLSREKCSPFSKACFYKDKADELLNVIEKEKSERIPEIESTLANLPKIYTNRGSLFLAVKAQNLSEEKEHIILKFQNEPQKIKKNLEQQLSKLLTIDFHRVISDSDLDENPEMKEWFEKKLNR